MDSGSTHSFLSCGMAAVLEGVWPASKPLQVRIADGGQLTCSSEIPDCAWWIQGHTFYSTFKVVPLGCYDVILGMDWLERHNPMVVDWVHKRLSFQYLQHSIFLQGVLQDTSHCRPLSAS